MEKVSMKRESDTMPCVGMYDNEYPIGFFLDPQQVKALGIDGNVEPGAMVNLVATAKVKSVTKREDQVEMYLCVTEMGVDGAPKKSPTAKLAGAYSKGESDGEHQT